MSDSLVEKLKALKPDEAIRIEKAADGIIVELRDCDRKKAATSVIPFRVLDLAYCEVLPLELERLMRRVRKP